MSRYFAPLLLSAILIAALVAINRGFKSLANYFSGDFPIGFLAGMAFTIAVYGLICWIDPSSRPRGSSAATNQQSRSDPFG